jgi:hypothetical protein
MSRPRTQGVVTVHVLTAFKEQFHRLADANSVSETAALRAQGLRSGPKLAFLSDGEDSIRSLQWHLSPRAQHLLDWFHLARWLHSGSPRSPGKCTGFQES